MSTMLFDWRRNGAGNPADDEDIVLIGSLTQSDTGSVNERCKTRLFSPRGSWDAAVPRPSGQNPLDPWPSISGAEEEKEDKITDNHNQEGEGGFSPLSNNERRLKTVQALCLKPRPARTPDHLREQARYQDEDAKATVEGGPPFCTTTGFEPLTGKSLLYHGPGNRNGGRRSPLHRPMRLSGEDLPIWSGLEEWGPRISIGNNDRAQVDHKQGREIADERKEEEKEGGRARLGPRLNHEATRLNTLQELTRNDIGVSTPANLPEAWAIIKRKDIALGAISKTNRDLRRQVNELKAESQTNRDLRRQVHELKAENETNRELRRQVDELRAESSTKRDLRRQVAELKDEAQQLRRERDSTKRKHDALDATLMSLFNSVSATATATARARISPDVDTACANTKRRAATVRSILENGARGRVGEDVVRPSYRDEIVSPPPLLRETPPMVPVVESPSTSNEKGGPDTKASVVVGRVGTVSTRSVTPTENTAAVPTQTPAAGLRAFSTRAPEEERAVVHKKERPRGRRNGNARLVTSGASGRVGLSAGPVSRSSARRQLPAASSQGLGSSECHSSQPAARQKKTTTASSAGVGPSTSPPQTRSTRLQPSNASSGANQPPSRPAHEPNSRRQPTIGASRGGGPSVRSAHHTSSRHPATVASSRGVGPSARPTTRPPARQASAPTNSSRRFMEGTEASKKRVRHPVRTKAPRGMVC